MKYQKAKKRTQKKRLPSWVRFSSGKKFRLGPATFTIVVFLFVLAEGIFYIHLNSKISQQTFDLENVTLGLENAKLERKNLGSESTRLSRKEIIDNFMESHSEEFTRNHEYVYLEELP